MIFLFSGFGDRKTYQMLDGIVTDFLVDEVDIDNIPQNVPIGMLDSGAFRLYRKNQEIDLEHYLHRTEAIASRCTRIVAPDVIGDANRTLQNYQLVKIAPHLRNKIVPVWGWNTPTEYLKFYLSESPLVGIGGLAETFHLGKTPEEKSRRDRVLSELKELCEEYPKRFHIFGLNYLKAIETLAPVAYSADSSVWLRGARYAYVIFVHERNQHLTQAPAKSIAQYASFDREGRCRESAKNINQFVQKMAA